jgi:peptidyl-prolyl cis-trans isomerase SurA
MCTRMKVARQILWFALAGVCIARLHAAPELVNGIAVIVNESVITYKDVQNRLQEDMNFLEQHYASQPKVLEEKARELKENEIEELVEYQLILGEFKKIEKNGYVLPESYVQRLIDDDIKKYGDRLTLTKTLQAQGITYETYRNKIRERTILELMWHQKVPNDPLISPTKIETYYVENRDKYKVQDEVKLRMLVITNQPNDQLFSPVKMCQEILMKLNENVPFSEMAKVYSQGSQATEGGDWGWVERSVLREDLAKAAFSLKPGEHSGVIPSKEGAYIMYVEDVRPEHIKSLAEVREEVESTLKVQENKRLRKQWIDGLKKKAFVRYFN